MIGTVQPPILKQNTFCFTLLNGTPHTSPLLFPCSYVALRSSLAFDRQLMLPLPGPPSHSGRIRFLRLTGRDLDDTDRAVAALVRPHLVGHLHARPCSARGSPTPRSRALWGSAR